SSAQSLCLTSTRCWVARQNMPWCYFLSCFPSFVLIFFFFFNDPPTTEIYTLSLHDALPICPCVLGRYWMGCRQLALGNGERHVRSEEHTSELQSLAYLVCRLLLEKKKHKTHSRLRDNRHVQDTTGTMCEKLTSTPLFSTTSY